MATVVNLIGLGVMGRPMARNLVASGFEVTGFSRTAVSRDRARGVGITVVDELADLPRNPDFVVTVLPDAPDVEAVLFAPDGPAARSSEATLFVDMSTISPTAARSIAQRLGTQGRRSLDAPVSGGEVSAINGDLAIMVGGEASDVAVARPLFAALGSTITRVGGHGAGQVAKAANQMIVAANLASLAEALVFVSRQGLDPAAVVEAIRGGLAGSKVMDRKATAMIDGNYTPGFRLALHDKDLGIVQREAAALGLPLELTALVTGRIHSLVEAGRGELDHGALYLAAAGEESLR